MHSHSLFVSAFLLITIGCKNDAAEREKALAERERDLARKELEALKAQQAQMPAAPPAQQAPEAPAAQPAAAQPAPAAPPSPPSPRSVTISVKVSVAATKPDGKPWDALGDAADPLITLSGPGISQSAGPFQNQPTAATTFQPVQLIPGDFVIVSVVDKDLQANDPIGSFQTKFKGAATVQGSIEGGTVSITFQ